VFQSFNLLPRTTAMENVELPMFYSHPLISLGVQRRRALAALEKVGLWRTRRAPAQPALRRPAAAHRHRPGIGQSARIGARR
jgi:ABC-type lipoprotein export system ATPase subunit